MSLQLARHDPRTRLPMHRQRVGQMQVQMSAAVLRGMRRQGDRLETLRARLAAVDPDAVLRRGFTLTFAGDGTLIRSTADAKSAGVLVTRTADGEVRSRVEPEGQDLQV